MLIKKTFEVEAPIDRVWGVVTDPKQVAQCVPGCENAEQVDDTYRVTVLVKLGPIKTKFNLNIACVEQRPPEYARYESKGDEGKKSSRLKATSTLALSGNGNNTSVTYESDFSLVGRLGKFGGGMMEKVADSIGNEFVSELKRIVEN